MKDVVYGVASHDAVKEAIAADVPEIHLRGILSRLATGADASDDSWRHA